jgi:adenine-specific DNA methylase
MKFLFRWLAHRLNDIERKQDIIIAQTDLSREDRIVRRTTEKLKEAKDQVTEAIGRLPHDLPSEQQPKTKGR